MASVTYSAPPGTECCLPIRGDEFRFGFGKNGRYTTSDEELIKALDAAATAEGHPIGFAPETKDE